MENHSGYSSGCCNFYGVYFAWPSIKCGPSNQQLTTLTATSNRKQQVTLADGSKVWINANAELKYPQSFNGKTREVYLMPAN